MRWAKVREKAKKYAPLIALLYFFFLLNGERHENHVLQSELAQLDHHLEMEFIFRVPGSGRMTPGWRSFPS